MVHTVSCPRCHIKPLVRVYRHLLWFLPFYFHCFNCFFNCIIVLSVHLWLCHIIKDYLLTYLLTYLHGVHGRCDWQSFHLFAARFNWPSDANLVRSMPRISSFFSVWKVWHLPGWTKKTSRLVLSGDVKLPLIVGYCCVNPTLCNVYVWPWVTGSLENRKTVVSVIYMYNIIAGQRFSFDSFLTS